MRLYLVPLASPLPGTHIFLTVCSHANFMCTHTQDFKILHKFLSFSCALKPLLLCDTEGGSGLHGGLQGQGKHGQNRCWL